MTDKKMELDELLERLTVAGDIRTNGALFRGLAVSRSDTALHLGTEGGIIEIPLTEISEVSEIGGHPNAVSVTVKDPSTVRPIRIEPDDDGGASSVVREFLSMRADGGTIPSGPYGESTKSTVSLRLRNNDVLEDNMPDDPAKSSLLLVW